MPRKNTIKTYVINQYYHLYNRGVNKSIVFHDQQDYAVFLKHLGSYLSAPLPQIKDPSVPPLYQHKNYHEVIDLVCFCLMPNHFHLLVYQRHANAISQLLSSLLTRFSMYINRRYKRTGQLWESRSKAVLVKNQKQLLHLSRYIHLNPSTPTTKVNQLIPTIASQPSSISAYLTNQSAPSWIKPSHVLQNLHQHPHKAKTIYLQFLQDGLKLKQDRLISQLTLD